MVGKERASSPMDSFSRQRFYPGAFVLSPMDTFAILLLR